jgi:hypothetical protein
MNTHASYSEGLGIETDCPYRSFSWFSLVPAGECRDRNLKLLHDSFLQNPFNSSFAYHPLIRRCIIFVTEKASFNKLRINKIDNEHDEQVGRT